jgi:fumarate hydratase class I
MAKGGGSANKSYLFQETKALLNPRRACCAFVEAEARALGTAACPPYHLAIVVGGTSAEYALKTAKLASAATSTRCRPRATPGPRLPRPRARGRGARDLRRTRHRRAVRRQVLLPRRAGDPPAAARRVVPGRDRVSCSADRQALGKITADGVFLEQLETRPGALPARDDARRARRRGGEDRPQPPDERDPRGALALPVKTRLSLTGPMVVARDIAHAKIKERLDAARACPST